MGFLDNTKVLFGIKNGAASPKTATVTKKVLIVEDEKTLGDLLETKLKQAGYTTLRAENGKMGLDVILAEKPAVVILDLMMPVMDGNTMLRSLRKMPGFEKLPVIVLTNAGTVDNMKDTKFYNNASEFLIKSNVSMDEIVSRVKGLAKI